LTSNFKKLRASRVVLVALLMSSMSTAHSADRPNVIVILADDMGYSDIGCYGSEIDTPNLDGLADKGLRFTQFYNTARSCSTRALLLTGLYPHQAGVGHMTNDYGFEGYRATRVDDWKLVAMGAKGQWELYNIARDREETMDLSTIHPDVAKDLREQWTAYAHRANVFPLIPRQARAKIDNEKASK
jgi:arylsulfatase A-like enzyme